MPDIFANGITIHYKERGSGEPLILIMGLGAPGNLWEDHVLAYEKHFRCIMIDNRGAGRSDQPSGPYTTRMMADDTAGLMQALGIETARVAGISMGSAIAQELALSYPCMVRNLVLISSWARCDSYTQAVFDNFKKLRAQVSAEDFTQLLQLWISSPSHYETHLNVMVNDQELAHKNYMALHSFRAQCDACSTHFTYDRLSHLTVPVLLTVGDADIFTPLRLTVEMHDVMPSSELLVFPRRGHIHHWEELNQFNKATLQFLMSH